MDSDGGVGAMIDRDVIMEIVENEDWGETRRYLKELKRDLRKEFEKLNECLACPANALFCSEVRRLAKSYERGLLAALMLRCFLNEALGAVEGEGTRKRLAEVLKITNDLVTFLNEKHDLIHRLVDKCRELWGGEP
jgi:hypothetical protein